MKARFETDASPRKVSQHLTCDHISNSSLPGEPPAEAASFVGHAEPGSSIELLFHLQSELVPVSSTIGRQIGRQAHRSRRVRHPKPLIFWERSWRALRDLNPRPSDP